MNDGESSDHAEPGVAPPTLADDTWMERALESSSDSAYVLDASTMVTWTNTAGAAVVGMRREELIGRLLADFVHPDDLVRAAEVLGLADAGVFDAVPITPALYRVWHTNGEWIDLEVSASLPRPDGSVLILARTGGDLVIADHLLEAVTANAPFDQQVGLVLELGRWRHPQEGYAISYDDIDGARCSVTSSGLDPALRGDTPIDEISPWSIAVRTGGEVVITDLTSVGADDARIGPKLAATAVRCGFVGCIAAPVADATRDTDACIVIWSTERGPTHAGHGYALANMTRALALVLSQRGQRYLLEQSARIDELTGMLTRAGFFDLIEHETNGVLAEEFSVLYIDLDGFKAVNDSYGHGVGDQVLVAAAQRIHRIAQAGSIAARLGGDEFVLVFATSSSPHPESIAQQIVAALGVPIETPTGPVAIGASVGIATGRGADAFSQILESSDHALLAAKAAGRSRWVTH